MKTSVLILSFCIFLSISLTAQKIEQDVDPFSKLQIGPGINVELIKSTSERVILASEDEEIEDIEIKVTNGTLKIGFENIDMDKDGWDWNDQEITFSRYSLSGTPYENVKIYAKIYFKQLKELEFRGDEKLFTKDILIKETFNLRVLGKAQLKIAGIRADDLTIKAYGESVLEILQGSSGQLNIKAYGENKLQLSQLQADQSKITSIGENQIQVYADAILKIKSIGTGIVEYKGNPEVKDFNIGESEIRRLE